MNDQISKTPDSIADLARRCIVHVKNRVKFELDYQNETLSVLDFFVSEVLKDEGGGEPLPLGDHRRAQLIHLLAPTIGAYFGEVLVRFFPCRWRMASEDPQHWMIEFENIPLRFNPAGAAAEALAEETVDSWSGALATAPEETEALSERLAIAPPVPINEFFAFTTRLEALQIAEDWLRLRLAAQDPPAPEFYSPEDYDRIFG